MYRGTTSVARALCAASRMHESESLLLSFMKLQACLDAPNTMPSLVTSPSSSARWASTQPDQPRQAQTGAPEPSQSYSATELAGLAAQLADSAYPPGGPPTAGRGPLLAYNEGKEEGLLRADPRQEATINQLQALYDNLVQAFPPPARGTGMGLTLVDAAPQDRDAESKRPWWTTLFGTSSTDIEAGGENAQDFLPNVQGLYMYGGVGCGKTMLMDLFAACSPPEFKVTRTHFHDFMLDIHSRLRTHQSTPDPLSVVADEVASSTRVLCLDEFFVTDVADAMILHRLFARLWDDGLVLVATSNRHPDALYEGGLQRALFLPFIHRLKNACVVHDMASPTDYRRLAQHRGGLYFTGKTREQDLYERFLELANNNPVQTQSVEVAMGRRLQMPRVGGCIALFNFEELCDRPLGAADYIALANSKHTVAITGVPVFDGANRTAAYRFVTLIDVLYEHRVRLLCSAEDVPLQLFENIMTGVDAKAAEKAGSSVRGVNGDTQKEVIVDNNLGFSKDRTVSRLTEMQSKEYLRAHAQRHAPELLYALEELEKRDKAMAR